MVLATVRWTQQSRRLASRQRNDNAFQLVDEWTKSLHQEVADLKQAQRDLQESHELGLRQERLAAVGQLTAGLAHEFNNIMTIVQGHASLLMDHPNLDEESAKSLAHITDGAGRMANLIRQMLAFSRKQVMHEKPLDVAETLGAGHRHIACALRRTNHAAPGNRAASAANPGRLGDVPTDHGKPRSQWA